MAEHKHRWKPDEDRGGHACLDCDEFRECGPNAWGQKAFTTVRNGGNRWTYYPMQPEDP